MREDGILYAELYPGAAMTLEDAELSLAAIPRSADGSKHLVLVDLRNLKAMTREAREFYASDKAAQRVAAAALLVASPISRVIGSFFIGLNKTRMPLRLFTSEKEAISWLRGYEE
jgi:hypothetical protein